MTRYVKQRFDSHHTLPETPQHSPAMSVRHANPALCHCAACDLFTQCGPRALP
jgi:hypothetical protein